MDAQNDLPKLQDRRMVDGAGWRDGEHALRQQGAALRLRQVRASGESVRKLSPTQEKALALLREPGNWFGYIPYTGGSQSTAYYYDYLHSSHLRVSTVLMLIKAGLARAVRNSAFDYRVVAVEPKEAEC